MEQLSKLLLVLGFFLVLTACDKLTTQSSLEPLEFDGLLAIEPSEDKSFILTWRAPRFVAVENYEIYILDLKQEPSPIPQTGDPSSAAPDILGQDTFSQILPADHVLPETEGRLLTLVRPEETSLRTPSLSEGLYAFQVKVLSSDGRRDTNRQARWIAVSALDSFQGLQLAETKGGHVRLQWLPYPHLKEGEDFQYTVYKGTALTEAVAVTKDTELLYSLAQEDEGSTVYFGVRFRDAQGREDRNKITLPIIVPPIDRNYVGCVAARVTGSDRIEITFEWPSERYESLRVLRGQKEVFFTMDRSQTSFIDRGLQEGETYQYTCQALAGRFTLTGSNVLSASTLSTNAPTFQGISKVFLEQATTAVVSWGVTTGIPAQKFQVYANTGQNVSWASSPMMEPEPNLLSARITELGDDLPYAFGVRSCGIGSCDTNIQQITLETGDAGPPRTPGVTSAVIVNGKAVLSAPWQPSFGGVAKRKIYVKEGGSPSTDISQYTLRNTVVVTSPTNPPVSLEFADIQNGLGYHFIVRDEDKHGQMNSSTQVASIEAGDLIPPEFGGLTSVSLGEMNQEDTTVTLRFIAIASQSLDPNGAHTYRVYLREGGGASCSEEYFVTSLDAKLFPAGAATYVVRNLKAGTLYGFCLKAADRSGNISTNTLSTSRRTLDLTAPTFDGIQSLTYNKEKGTMRVTWNPSPSSDILEYQLQTWHTPGGSTVAEAVTLNVKHSDHPSEFQFNSGLIPFGSQSRLEVVVNACDNGASLLDGRQNCSAFTRAQGFVIVLQDIQPPPGFLGIAASSELQTPTEGTILVKWNAPTSWNDYDGFQVFSVSQEGLLTLLKDCPCLQKPNCLDQRTTCTIDGLEDYRTYTLHVRAYDANNNITVLDPFTASARKRTTDTTAPTFTSNLSLSFADGAVSLAWAAATDNQSPNEVGATIRYRLYRKHTTNFNNLLAPEGADVTIFPEQETLNFVDTNNLESGTTYFYTVCAFDASGNRTCDGSFKSFQTPDLIAPTIASFTTTKTESDKSWTLNWTMSDNNTAASALVVRIRELTSTDPNALATEADRSIFTQTGAIKAESLTGPINADTYVHYLLTVTDAAGNKASKTLKVHSTNRVVVESVRSTEGPTTGQKLLIVKGQGFHSSTRLEIGGTVCSNLQVISSRHALCTTPAKAEGTYALAAINGDGSSASLNNAYTYCVPGVSCTKICNNSNSWEAQFAIETGRGGSEASPLVICTATHLDNLRSQAWGRFYQLGDNIDLGTIGSNSFAPLTNTGGEYFQGGFEGDGHIVANLTYSAQNTDFLGLFRRIAGNSRVRNLGVINFDVRGRDYVGALSGNSLYDANTVVDEILVTGRVEGRFYVGLALGAGHTSTSNIAAFGDVRASAGIVGGVIGQKYFNGSNLEFEGTVETVVPDYRCYTGGVVGFWIGSQGTAFGLRAKADVKCSRATGNTGTVYRVGGLIGRLDTQTIKDSSFSGTVTGDAVSSDTGGAVGLLYNSAHLDNVSVSGTVSGSICVGGLVGCAHTNQPSVIRSSSSAQVIANSVYVGGAIGLITGTALDKLSIVSQVKSSGKVSGGTDHVGGLIGVTDYVSIDDSSSTTTVENGHNVGGLIGVLRRSTLRNSFASGSVKAIGGSQIGGLVGNMTQEGSGSTIENSFALGSVEGKYHLGGLVGYCRGIIRNSHAKGDITGTGVAGGLCGRNGDIDSGASSLIEGSYATGRVSVTDEHGGGLIGHIYRRMSIRTSYASGRVDGLNNMGGFVGSIDQGPIVIEQSYASGPVYGNARVGGFLGYAYRYDTGFDLKNNYARGDVYANSDAGGFVGLGSAVISFSYSSGRVSQQQTASNLGGFAGRLLSGGTNSTPACYWDTEQSGRSSSASGAGRTSSEMKDPATYVDFDTSTIWILNAGQYPILRWQTPN